MRKMFNNMFMSIATLFGAINRGANALDSFAKYAEDEARFFEEQSAYERQQKIDEYKHLLEAPALKAA